MQELHSFIQQSDVISVQNNTSIRIKDLPMKTSSLGQTSWSFQASLATISPTIEQLITMDPTFSDPTNQPTQQEEQTTDRLMVAPTAYSDGIVTKFGRFAWNNGFCNFRKTVSPRWWHSSVVAFHSREMGRSATSVQIYNIFYRDIFNTLSCMKNYV